MLYPAELRGRSADRPNRGIRPNPARLHVSRKLDQRFPRCNAQCAGAARPARKASPDMSKPLLIGRIRDTDLLMRAMVEEGCIDLFGTRIECVSDQTAACREGVTA